MKDKNHSDDELYKSTDELSSISDDARIDAIVDFYKDKPIPPDSEESTNPPEPSKNPVTEFLNRVAAKIKPDAVISTDADGDESIQTGTYGLAPQHRAMTSHIITAVICIAIISGAYLLAVLMPGDTEIINNYAEELRKDENYISLSNQNKTLEYEVSKLKASNEAKQTRLLNISDYDNTKAALRSEISKKAEELSTLNAQITEKRAMIDTLNGNIAQKASSVITLNAGKYVIGTNIAAGKYYVTGSGTFSAASSNNVSKYNFTLGSTASEVVLEKGDIIKINSTTKFTSAN